MAQPKEILIVDDEVGIRELLSEILQDEGYRVSVAENAGEARSYRARSAAFAGAARYLDARYRRRDAAARVGGQRPADDAGGDDVGPRHHRDRGRGDQDRRVRFPRKAGRIAEAAVDGDARAEDCRRPGPAAHLARGARHQRVRSSKSSVRSSSCCAPTGRCWSSASPAQDTNSSRARCTCRTRRSSRSPTERGSRRIRCSCSRRRATGTFTAPKSAAIPRPNRRGSRSCCRSSKSTTRSSSARAASNSAISPPKAASTRRCCRPCRSARSCCRRLRQRRDDIPALVDRFWREITASQRTFGTLHAAAVAALCRGVLAGQPRPSAQRHRQSGADGRAAKSPPSTSGGCSARRRMPPPTADRARGHGAIFRIAAARGARGVRANLLRAAARQGAEQHEPRRRARRTRAHASVPQAEAAQHPLLAAIGRGSMLSHRRRSRDGRRVARKRWLPLVVGAIGVVFGDIGTSPLYTLRECFTGPHGLPLTADERLRNPVGHLLGDHDRRDAQVRDADHARRQSRRGRHHGAYRARLARPRQQAHALVAGRLRDLRRGDVLRRRHDHAGDLGALRGRRARGHGACC